MKKYILLFLLVYVVGVVGAQNIPQSMDYTQIYDLLDELATDRIIPLNSAIKPYSRNTIARLLLQAQAADSLLNKRQREEVQFFLNEYSLERDTMPNNFVQWTNKKTFNLSLAQPALHAMTENKQFKFSLKPILGMDIYASKKGAIIKRWWGAEINMDIAHHLSIWGSLRDVSYNGNLLNKNYFPDSYDRIDGAKLTKGQYLNNLSGVQYKEASYGGDFSDSKGGISLYTWWGSIGLQRENIQWGDAYHCSNILSGHNPAVPMVTLKLTPCKWFEFNYFHAWLVSNVLDSTRYYVENATGGVTEREYRPANKFMAANMFTFMPIQNLGISFGNSIVYAEQNVQAAYFIPIAFYKSLDHLLTKGTATENQNSQVFFSVSTRNLKHLHVYGSFYLDEFKFARLKKSNSEKNPVSYLVGLEVSNWPLKNLSVKGEFMRSYIACYTHSIDVLTYQSNSYEMGHYMGDNAQNVYAEITYRPVRGLKLSFSYTGDTKYNSYAYLRAHRTADGKKIQEGSISETLSQKPFNDKIYRNNTFELSALYEAHSGMYAVVKFAYNHAQGYAPTSTPIASEDRGQGVYGGTPLTGDALASYYLNKYCPAYLQGKNFTFMCGFGFNF